ncbi:ABC transporter permease [Anaerococcus prevotii]|uniref:Putative oligopeptide ABC transporter, permease protein AppB n=1 Tax=Anaerococcus prevotii ACS-065-V-Col13 TaxID=879305 RepID=F0GUU2_9FIRM|nr:ABC transporter permease [Anaerococcus prevotii]EGC82437.1 putative oligopeptide ABC transporter, permease protein AppB [Anaerococcus prevotii ACS-065-V-Col13]MDU5148763.1 ABC transporter permease [Anaerococcus prevotii]
MNKGGSIFKYILKKLIFMIPMLVIISFLIFMALQFMPVDPINYLLPPDAAQNEALRESLRETYGLNDPVIVQYGRWITNILKGDFGYSITNGQQISTILAQKLPATLELAITALIISSVLGILLGILSAVNQNGVIDYIGRVIGVVGQSIPQFLFGIILIDIFALKLGKFPVGGRNLYGLVTFGDKLHNMFLPSLALSLGMIATVLRYTRNSMLDVMNKEYIKTARSKGVPEWKVYLKHAFRNSIGPIMVTILLRIPGLIGGSVVIESVFNWPGIGSTLMGAVTSGDYPIIMVITLLIATVMLVVSFMVDVLSAILDPRIRLD